MGGGRWRGVTRAENRSFRAGSDTSQPRLAIWSALFNPPPDGGKGRSGSFDLLGFTHYWDRSRKGGWVVRRKTAKDRLSRTLRRINVWCRDNRHSRIGAQHAALSRKLRGHDAYYGITGNYRALDVLRLRVTEIWRKWLHRRSWKGRVPWDDMNRLLERFPLPRARVVHSTYRVANP